MAAVPYKMIVKKKPNKQKKVIVDTIKFSVWRCFFIAFITSEYLYLCLILYVFSSIVKMYIVHLTSAFSSS